jgi:hypothetical protein
MSYRICLQTAGGGAYEKTETGSRSIAEAVFKSFLGRDELDGKPVSLHLVQIRSTLAVSPRPESWVKEELARGSGSR